MSKLTWRQLLVYTAYFFAALTIVGIAYTLYQWIQNPDEGQWEPLNVLADSAYSLFSAVASFAAAYSSRKASDKPITFFSSPPESLSEANWQRHRDNTLRNVESAWIDGYLKNAVHKSVEIELGLTYQPEAVSRTWGMILKRADQEDEPIPVTKSIYKIFKKKGRSLLILGEPASGKTITMLQLAERLIRKAQKDKTHPIPLVLNLSSWAAARQPLVEWLVEEIFLQYQVARGLTRSWLEHGHLLLLLDGLDEVAKGYRDDCVQAINEFKAHYAIEVVVCSRTQDYKRLSQQLNLPNAILIQPLTVGEMNRYLTELGSSTSGIRSALADDKELQELAESPLLLSLMPIAYGGLERAAIATSASLETNRRRLLDVYIGRMFERRPLPVDIGYTQDQALRWLANLARGMSYHNQSDFYIEQLQSTWLIKESSRQHYRVFAHLLVGLVFGLFGSLFGSLFGGLPGGLRLGVGVGLIFGLGLKLEIETAEKLSWSWPDRKQIIILIKTWVFVGLRFGLLGGLLSGLFVGLSVGTFEGLVFGLFSGLFGGLSVGTFVGAFVGMGGLVNNSVQVSKAPQQVIPNQGIRNSGRNALIMTVFVGITFGIIVGLFVLLGVWLFVLLGIGMGIGISDWLTVGMVIGMDIGMGDWLTVDTMVLGVGYWPGFMLFVVLIVVLGIGMRNYGGNAVIQHYTLRLLLARHNIIPFARDKHLIDYLDKMAERIILRRVGGRWVFIHRYLLEHFASLREATAEDKMTNS